MDTSKKINDRTELGVGMLGYAFMGKAHTNAFLRFPFFFLETSAAIPKLVAICGRSKPEVSKAASRYGYSRYYTDWRKLVQDEQVDVVDNGLPNNLHAQPCIEAAENGKHLICEKPLGMNSKQSRSMLEAAERAHVKHMVAFNYRFVPAIILAKQLIGEGQIGRVLEFRAAYLQEWIMDESFPLVWRLRKSSAGSGVLGDLGSHMIDLARFLVGEVDSTVGLKETFVKQRPLLADKSPATRRSGEKKAMTSARKGRVDVDDIFIALLRFMSGAVGSVEGSRFAAGRKNFARVEIHGSEGSLLFNLERLNELQFYTNRDREDRRGFRTISVTEPVHPFMKSWWPPGHVLGWEHTLVHEMYHFFNAVARDEPIDPSGATFRDGLRVDQILESISKSAESGRWERAI